MIARRLMLFAAFFLLGFCCFRSCAIGSTSVAVEYLDAGVH